MIFVSHTSTDDEKVRQIADALKAGGVEVWLAGERIQLSRSIPRAMSGGLERSSRILVLWSVAACASPHVMNEIDAFYMLHPGDQTILFVLLDETPLPTLYVARFAIRFTGTSAELQAIVGWSKGDSNALPSHRSIPPLPETDVRRYARGPLVKGHWIPRSIEDAYAALAHTKARKEAVIHEAIRIREAADPGDPHVTTLSLASLPPVEFANAYDFWHEAFQEACKHGPRMLAALLFALPDTQFPTGAQRYRAELLLKLRLR